MPLNRYQIATLNTPFDSTYLDVVRFDTRAAQQTYFNVSELFNGAPFINFDPKTLLNTDIYYVMPDGVPAEMLGHNYCIIKDNAAEVTPAYYYYFIKQSEFDAGKQVHLTLELDIYQTYYIDTEFQDCFITKAHLNRFIKKSNGNLYFDFTPESNLFVREEITGAPKRLINLEECDISYPSTIPSVLSTFLRTHIAGWAYVYLKKNESGYKFQHALDSTRTPESEFTETSNFGYDFNGGGNDLRGAYNVFAVPIFKTPQSSTTQTQWRVKHAGTESGITIGVTGISGFIRDNGSSDVLSIKFSHLPPWNPEYDFSDFTITVDSTGRVLTMEYPDNDQSIIVSNGGFRINGTQGEDVFYINSQKIAANYSLFAIFDADKIEINGGVAMPLLAGFSASEVKGDRNIKYNPKVYSQDFSEMVVFMGSSSASFDFTKLGKNYAQFKYSEGISPDVLRAAISIVHNDDDPGVYIEDSDKEAALSITQDTTMPFAENQLDTYLANNKNFYQQRDINLSYQEKVAGTNFGFGLAGNIVSGVFGGVGAMQAKSGLFKTMLGENAVKAGLGIAQTSVNYGLSLEGIENQRIQSDLTLDNMRNAPQNAQGVNGNMFTMFNLNKYSIYAGFYQALKRDLAAADDQMFIYGYNYNRIDNVKNVDNIRHYFNYVRANLTTMSTPFGMPDEVHDAFRQLFERGLRMWNVTDQMFKYEKENYENWLDEEAGA